MVADLKLVVCALLQVSISGRVLSVIVLTLSEYLLIGKREC